MNEEFIEDASVSQSVKMCPNYNWNLANNSY